MSTLIGIVSLALFIFVFQGAVLSSKERGNRERTIKDRLVDIDHTIAVIGFLVAAAICFK